MAAETQRIADNSTLVGAVHAALTQLRAWLAASWLATTVTTLTNGLATTTRASLLAEGVRTNVYWIRHSFCYRWLTTEPEPDVVVIDLRDTYAVGPFIALVDRITPTAESAWRTSGMRRLTAKLTAKKGWFEDSRTLALLAAALEPPEPPEEQRE